MMKPVRSCGTRGTSWGGQGDMYRPWGQVWVLPVYSGGTGDQ